MDELLYYFELTGRREETEIVNELLPTLDIEFCAKTDIKKGISNYSFYSNTQEEAEEKHDIIFAAVKSWAEMNLELSLSKIMTLKKEDWTEVWKKFFKIQHISDRVVIKASWLDYTPKEGQIVIEIDPGMSFGTGSHETTQYCLQALEAMAAEEGKTLLDAGCGSGILSIAALKLGYKPVNAFDYDYESVLSCIDNFYRNKVDSRNINLLQADIAEYDPETEFDFVVANIISSVLTANRDRLISWVKPGGNLILAGILRTEFETIKNYFMESGQLIEISNHTEKEWTGALFKKKEA